MELPSYVCDLLSLAGFGSEFISFHDITKAQLSGVAPSQDTGGFRQIDEAAC